MRYICLIILTLLMVGCSEKKFDRERADELCAIADTRHLTPDETAEMISLDAMALSEVEARLHALLDRPGSCAFAKEYQALKTDSNFVEMSEIGEKMWRILLLARPWLTESNAEAFDDLYDTCRLVDLYRDDLSRRVNDE